MALAWRRLRQWPALKRFLSRLAGHLTTRPADDFAHSTRTSLLRHPSPEGTLAPSAFEQRFARLQREGRYEDMWSMLADDAQRSWGGADAFSHRMREQAANVELLDANVQDVDFITEWTDRRAGHTYRNVARLDVSYRVKHGQREWALRRQVHLVPAGDGWRTLWYPQPEGRSGGSEPG